MIKQIDYLPSRKCYALALDRSQITDHDSYTSISIPAIWVGGSRANPKLSLGSLIGFHDSIDQMMHNFDSRYGGAACATWDGECFWTEGRTPWDRMVEQQGILNEVYLNLPELPTGYQGWFDIRS